MAIGKFPAIKIREEYTCIAKVAIAKWLIVMLDSINTAGDMVVDLPSAATIQPFGVSIDGAAIGGKIRICTDGDVMMTGSAAIATFMTKLAFDTAGKCAAAAPAAGVNATLCGFNYTACSGANGTFLGRFQSGIMQGQ